MGKIEIVAYRGSHDLVFREKQERLITRTKKANIEGKNTREAGSQCTLNKPIFCPNNGETLNFKNSKSIYFVTFQGIIKGIPMGTTKFVIPILSSFEKEIKQRITYFVSNNQSKNEDINIQEVSRSYKIALKFLALINRFVIKVPSYKMRFIQERLFDFFVYLRIKEPVVLISTAYLLKATAKNKKFGGINIFLAGNPDDYEIHHLLKSEQKKHAVIFHDAYTYEKRIKFVSRSVFSFDHIITFTISEYESFSKRIPKERLSFIESHIIPNPQTFPEIKYSKNNEITFCYVAHPFWLKGLPYLLEALSSINIDGSRLRIAGRIDNQIRKFIDEHYTKLKNVEYLGWVEDLNQFFRTSHVCIVPSLLDAGPATIAEAMYCGLPVIVSDGCGAKSLVKEGENGFVVPAGKSEAIAEKISWFYNNQSQIPEMGKNAKTTINEFFKGDQNDKVAKHIFNIIARLQTEKRNFK